MRSNFTACLAEILAHEGGYIDHPKDPGGATNMGITHQTLAQWRGRPVTKADVRQMSRTEAADIYHARYWTPIRGNDLPAGVDLATFDPAVNSGVGRGARWLQRAVGMAGADVDGMIGSKTLSAVRSRDSVSVIKAICATRMGFLRGLGTWTTFGRGWSRRVASIEARGVQMAGGNIRQEQAQAAAAARREETAGAGSGAVGAGTAITDLPMPYDLIQWLLVGLLLAAAAVLIARSRHDRNRAAAYAAVTTEG